MLQRDIHLYRRGATSELFEAWCAVDQARRSFWFGSTLEAIDLTTGEILTLPEFFRRVHPTRRFPAWLNE